MSNLMDPYLLSDVPRIVDLQRSTAQTVEARIDEAVQRMQIALSDSYENISVFSVYWKSDDTGSVKDSSLFIQTLSKLQNIQTFQRSLSDEDGVFELGVDLMASVRSQSGSRKLFILHYAGHAIAGSTPNALIITPKIGQELDCGPEINMSIIKDQLKSVASKSPGLDVLLVMDSFCAAIAGRGGKTKGARMELMAATAAKGISNSIMDGRTFTQHWCEAFTKLWEIGKPFTCDDIIKVITPDSELEQFPSAFVLREGWDIPIKFHLHPGPIESTSIPAAVSQTVITALHIQENPNSLPLKQLIDYLNKAPVPITVLAVLPTSSTLLLLRVPVFLQELLRLPQVALLLTDY